jgi:ubiquitin carboxyl-terminal hydrolase 25
MHRGQASAGHYWIFIYDFERKIWRKYNDNYVETVQNLKEIFEPEEGVRPATCAFLVYVKEGLEKDLTNAVCRDIDPNLQEDNDVIMDDISPYEKLHDWSQGLKDGSGDTVMGGTSDKPEHEGITW